jgi:hypothetical protein
MYMVASATLTDRALGDVGRLGNQLSQTASTIGLAAAAVRRHDSSDDCSLQGGYLEPNDRFLDLERARTPNIGLTKLPIEDHKGIFEEFDPSYKSAWYDRNVHHSRWLRRLGHRRR